jgi:hypothetical protein
VKKNINVDTAAHQEPVDQKYLCQKHKRPAVVELNEEYYCWECYPGLKESVRKDKLNGRQA